MNANGRKYPASNGALDARKHSAQGNSVRSPSGSVRGLWEGASASGWVAGILPRRILLVALVLLALIPLLGCATVDVQCGMRADYADASPVAPAGRVELAWAYQQGFPDNRYGEAIVSDRVVVIRMAGEPPTHNDICAMARLGHEVAHGMKGRH